MPMGACRTRDNIAFSSACISGRSSLSLGGDTRPHKEALIEPKDSGVGSGDGK